MEEEEAIESIERRLSGQNEGGEQAEMGKSKIKLRRRKDAQLSFPLASYAESLHQAGCWDTRRSVWAMTFSNEHQEEVLGLSQGYVWAKVVLVSSKSVIGSPNARCNRKMCGCISNVRSSPLVALIDRINISIAPSWFRLAKSTKKI